MGFDGNAYCLKCLSSVELEEIKISKSVFPYKPKRNKRTGVMEQRKGTITRNFASGKCPECKKNVSRIISNDDFEIWMKK